MHSGGGPIYLPQKFDDSGLCGGDGSDVVCYMCAEGRERGFGGGESVCDFVSDLSWGCCCPEEGGSVRLVRVDPVVRCEGGPRVPSLKDFGNSIP